MKYLVRNVRIIDPQSSYNGQWLDVLLENGQIADMQADMQVEGVQEIQIEGLHVSPGWFDLGARFGEPGDEQKETLRSGAEAAQRGGFTTVCIYPSTQPAMDNAPAISALLNRISGFPAHILPFGALTLQREGREMAELLDMRESGAVAFSDDRRSVENPKLLELILDYLRPTNDLVISFADTPALRGKGMIHEGNISLQTGLKGIPAVAEEMAVTRDILLAEYTGGRIHFPVVSLVKSIESIHEAKCKGISVTCGISPQYLWFTDEDVSSFSADYKVLPPYRSAAECAQLVDKIKEGKIDVICSDHSPEDTESKICELEQARFGISSIETAVPAAWTVLREMISLDELIQLVAINPRKILDITPVILEKGMPAELTFFLPEAEWVFEKPVSKGVSNPFVNKKFTGKPVATYINGRLIHCA